MSKFKNMSAAGWFVAGVAVAVLLVPTTVGAVAALKYTGITGPSANKADVTGAGQLQVAAADPSKLFQSAMVTPNGSTGAYVVLASPPAGSGLIVTTLHFDTVLNSYPGPSSYTEVEVQTGSTCSGSLVGVFDQKSNPLVDGEIDLSLAPGLGVPAGDSLCARANLLTTYVSASGYLAPATAVTPSAG